MKLSAQEEYGLRCLLRLGRRDLSKSLTIPEISQAEGISTHNVAKLLRMLQRLGDKVLFQERFIYKLLSKEKSYFFGS